MAFDFKERAFRREQKEAADSARRQAAQEKREGLAAALAGAFSSYAQDDLYRFQMTASQQGTEVLFSDGAKEATVVILDPGMYDAHFSTIQLDGDPPGEDRRARYTSDDDLMDALTAWALNRR